MNKKTHSQVFDSAAREHIPDQVDLTTQIMAHIQSKRKGVSMNPKFKRAMTVLVVTTIFLITFANVPTVVHAFQALLGYIPGVGTVDSADSLRVLAEPVSQEKEGVTVTIHQGAVDSHRTILTMSISGLTATEYNLNCLYGDSHDPWLTLPDGTKLALTQFTGIGPTRYDLRYYFPSLPKGVDSATLQIPCLLYGDAPRGWKIPLRFGPADGLTPLRVIEIDPATPGVQAAAQSPYSISAILEQVILLEDGYIFSFSLVWGDGHGALNNILSVTPDVVQIADADGNKLAAEWVAPDNPDRDTQIHERETLAYKVSGKEHAWPLTINIVNTQVRSINSGGYRFFKLDLGTNPQIGQRWTLNQDLTGHLHTLHLNSAALINDPQSGKPGILFNIQSDTDVLDLWLEDAQSDGHFTSLLSSNTQPGHISVGLVFDDGIPAGERTFMVGGMAVLAHGNWQMTWQP